MTACVTMKPRNTGSSTLIASFMPRRLSSSSTATIASPLRSFHFWNAIGSSENIASTQARVGALPAPAGRKQLDHLVVGERDQEHRHHRREREVKTEMGMLAERLERFLGSVAR